MPRLLLYEECVAAGTVGPLADGAKVFFPEGLAMTLAVAEDFAKLPGWEVIVPRTPKFASRMPREVAWQWIDTGPDIEAMLARETKFATATIVIAPECARILQQRAQIVIDAGGKLLGSSPELIALASDKTAVLDHLAASGIRVPRGYYYDSHFFEPRFNYPVVLKPNDGAGSDEVRSFSDRDALLNFLLKRRLYTPIALPDPMWRCEEFIPGQAASVAVLNGPAGPIALRPATQRIIIGEDGNVSYQGGAMNLNSAEETRAQKLGLAVANALPPTNGYFGVDLILGEAADGRLDTVIEVNPRLTTSYLGLRHATSQSLADVMWQTAHGETVDINWLPNTVEFTKQGLVTIRDRSRP